MLSRLAVLAMTAACAAAPAAADEAPGEEVRVHVVSVRATGSPEAGKAPDVAPDLDGLPLPWAQLGFGRYEPGPAWERTAGWEQRLQFRFAGQGRYAVTPRRGPSDAQPISLDLEERLPGHSASCIAGGLDVAERQKVNLFCNVPVDGVTHLFVVWAELAR